MDFEDPVVKRVSQCTLVALMLTLVSIAWLTSWLVQDWDGQVNRSASLVQAIDALPRLSGERSSDVQSLAAVLLGAIPLMVAPVCFSMDGGKRRLNVFGGIMVTVLLVALALSVFGYLGIDTKWKDGHALELEGLVHAQQWARTVLSACVFYLASLLGIKAKP